MNSSPFETYEEAVEMGAYFTFADNEFMIILMTVLGFGFSLWALWKMVKMESANMDEAVAKLSDKYGS